MARLCKYMLNALYGKFGEKKVIKETYDTDTSRKYWREEVIDTVRGGTWVYTYLMNKLTVEHSEGEGDKSIVSIAAHVTDNARMTLWYLINSVGRERVLYCDTDSVIIRRDDMQYVRWPISDTDLGSVKVERVYHDLEIWGAKNYHAREGRKLKGVPDKAIEVRPGVYVYDQFARQKTSLRDGNPRGVVVRQVVKKIVPQYDKGEVNKDGTVVPLTFSPIDRPSELPLPF